MSFLQNIYNTGKIKSESEEINTLPRYTPGKTYLFGKRIEFVDACTYLGGLEHIFKKEIYKFNCTNKIPYIIDCGSNIGLSILYFKNIFPKAKILGFEPDPSIFKVLKNNILSFDCENVDLVNKAVWINNDTIQFQVEGGFSGRIPKKGDTTHLINIPSARLRDFLDREVDFLKIDIEGAETEVITDCKDRLKNARNVFIEYHSHVSEKQSLHLLLEILVEAGFRYHIHEAFTRRRPYVDTDLMLGMDLQLDIFAHQ